MGPLAVPCAQCGSGDEEVVSCHSSGQFLVARNLQLLLRPFVLETPSHPDEVNIPRLLPSLFFPLSIICPVDNWQEGLLCGVPLCSDPAAVWLEGAPLSDV